MSAIMATGPLPSILTSRQDHLLDKDQRPYHEHMEKTTINDGRPGSLDTNKTMCLDTPYMAPEDDSPMLRSVDPFALSSSARSPVSMKREFVPMSFLHLDDFNSGISELMPLDTTIAKALEKEQEEARDREAVFATYAVDGE
eukprot:TRINITY_DN826_c0_g1_i12.p2 TRINITY_DN826_c0_g1~~TRINITY_DN826_c0_g1_i12.p2  ORF type:complete len:142 (-),score=22.45 TRINITY_DN826_c0_g1_i12:477-902(-)